MSSSYTKYAVVVAGGSGSRMESSVPKQLLLLGKQPILLHTLQRFIEFDKQMKLIVVLHPSLVNSFNQLVKQYNFNHPLTLVEGGETRFHSVKNGLDAIPQEGVVGIHDAARPLVSIETINRAYTCAWEKGNAIPVIALAESIRMIEPENNRAVDRTTFRIIQTPQCFKVSIIKKAFDVPYNPSFTDDATVLEHNGGKINLVEGNPENIKITVPSDLILAEALMNIHHT